MDDSELERLLKDLESDRAERKESMAERDRICQAICAFANDLPNHDEAGVIFVGVNNDGTCANLPITDQLLLRLAHMRDSGNILPLPAMTVQKRAVGGCEMAVIVVEPADSPPVRYRGRVWIRVGPRRAVASAQEERFLAEKRRARDLPFDVRSVSTATLDDLDVDMFRRVYLPSALPQDVLEANTRCEAEQLASMRFATPPPECQPTVIGTLVVGKDPREFLPGAYVQFLRIDGSDLTDPIKDQKVIDGPLPDLLRVLDDTLQAHISVASDIASSPVEQTHSDYPLVALQQLVRNAVLHRTYDGTNAPVRVTWFADRIEIHSPGGPFGQVNRQNFGEAGVTDYRNPHLAEAMRNLGYVQRFGVGIPLARKALERNGNPEVEFVVEAGHVLAIVRRRS